jgi:hypothetical protein
MTRIKKIRIYFLLTVKCIILYLITLLVFVPSAFYYFIRSVYKHFGGILFDFFYYLRRTTKYINIIDSFNLLLFDYKIKNNCLNKQDIIDYYYNPYFASNTNKDCRPKDVKELMNKMESNGITEFPGYLIK